MYCSNKHRFSLGDVSHKNLVAGEGAVPRLAQVRPDIYKLHGVCQPTHGDRAQHQQGAQESSCAAVPRPARRAHIVAPGYDIRLSRSGAKMDEVHQFSGFCSLPSRSVVKPHCLRQGMHTVVVYLRSSAVLAGGRRRV